MTKALLGNYVAQAGEVGAGPQWGMEARADPVFNREGHSHRLRQHEDVAEDDGRVYPDEVNRLECYLHRQLRGTHHGEEIGSLPHRTVLGQVAAGLSHHPDGGAFDRLAAAGS